MSLTTDSLWDINAIRRAIRVLAAQPSPANDVPAVTHAVRLVWDILRRRGFEAEVFQLPGMMPLIISGNGPVLLLTYLDDSNPSARLHDGTPPMISGGDVAAPGVVRKAGILAALGSLFGETSSVDDVTLVVEADRHNGSRALDAWFRSADRRFVGAMWEAADLPVPAPALYRASMGTVRIRINVSSGLDRVDGIYSGVLPDIGHQLLETLAAIKSRDAEVLVPHFYDGVTAPDADQIDSLISIAPGVGSWLTRDLLPSEAKLSPVHLTLGLFCAPSITIRELRVEESRASLPSKAEAVIEVRLLPGQDTSAVVSAIGDFIRDRVPDATVDPVLVRPPATGGGLDALDLSTIAPMLPIAPGDSPAGLLEAAGVSSIGFSTVWHDPALDGERVSLQSIVDGSRLLQCLRHRIAGVDPCPDAPGR